MRSSVIPLYKIDISTYRSKSAVRTPLGRIPVEYTGENSANLATLMSEPPQALRSFMPIFMDHSIRQLGLPAIVIKFVWPGYEKYDFSESVPVRNQSDGHILLSVALAYKNLLHKAAKVHGSDPRYALTPNSPYANVSNLGICALLHVYADIFVVEVEFAPAHRDA
ncbi:hypothetical protein BC628DRAFT_1095040 [Trametes gibbosa]|nr:hypothetical protein BC628DRAFT_1095040 [Trametes gibbosa]